MLKRIDAIGPKPAAFPGSHSVYICHGTGSGPVEIDGIQRDVLSWELKSDAEVDEAVKKLSNLLEEAGKKAKRILARQKAAYPTSQDPDT